MKPPTEMIYTDQCGCMGSGMAARNTRQADKLLTDLNMQDRYAGPVTS